ncbi:HPF/RaiA family ribosome-associated protein [Humisphaera borealis]|uniref:HPF/RaiA family ribosome-associated protein n=1 Tax=Humisphaera borealis TaxID=2807512 RepID=A0A7M2X6E0_9BACT|nr:HPF/RaiA family ribosome-associated protein [Humisphaera borealis]
MQVQVNTDHNVKGSEALELHVQSTVDASLGRFGDKITRVEIHLSDDNGSKSKGDDKRCLLEARPAGMKPLVVTHVGGTINEAVGGAVDKMKKLLDSTFAKRRDPQGRTLRGESPAAE